MVRKVPAKIIIHESGRRSIVEGDIMTIEIRDRTGKIDKQVTEYSINSNLPRKELRKMMEKPQDFNIKKYGGRKKQLRK